MFSQVKPNSLFYILDKNNEPTIKIGKVANVGNVNYSNPMSQTIKIAVNVDNGVIEFDNLPANLSFAVDTQTNMIVSDNPDDMTREVENLLSASNQILDSVEYHKKAVEAYNSILVKLSPRLAKQKEQEDKIQALESKVGSIENGISDMKAMMVELLNKNK